MKYEEAKATMEKQIYVANIYSKLNIEETKKKYEVEIAEIY